MKLKYNLLLFHKLFAMNPQTLFKQAIDRIDNVEVKKLLANKAVDPSANAEYAVITTVLAYNTVHI